MLYRYAALVKNLRGVVWASGEGVDDAVASLSRRFRYRDLGVSAKLVRLYERAFQGRLEGRPYHVLGYPTERVSGVAARLVSAAERRGVDSLMYESLLLASSYACPLIVLGSGVKALEPVLLHAVHGPEDMDDASVRLHLRIVDYSILDSFTWSVEQALRLPKGEDLAEIVKRREEYCVKDAKRFWRIAGKGGKVRVAYLDPLKVFERSGLPADVLSELDGETGVLLAVVTAFVM